MINRLGSTNAFKRRSTANELRDLCKNQNEGPFRIADVGENLN